MLLSEFNYELPPDRIAQEPSARRDASRLMVLDRRTGEIGHRIFSDLPDYLRSGDLLVLNDTRVVPARLLGRRAAPGASARVEALLVEPAEPASEGDSRSTRVFKALVKGARREGDLLDFGMGLLGRLVGRADGPDGLGLLELQAAPGCGPLDRLLEAAGRTPLPPYIRRGPEPEGAALEAADRERYQTVYASARGALAAPTAGLHFTIELLERLASQGVRTGALTLHVGFGTFQPVRAARVEDHRMHAERFVLPEALARALAGTREGGGRVVAVGTTAARVLEARASREDGGVDAGDGWCDLFILPGHRFRVVDALLTNFHLPRSTLLMLVSAFAGRENILRAYRRAIEAGYRFYSYGDAMLIA